MFFSTMASTTMEGEKKNYRMIDDSTKAKVRCLHSFVTLLFRLFYYDDNEGGSCWNAAVPA